MLLREKGCFTRIPEEKKRMGIKLLSSGIKVSQVAKQTEISKTELKRMRKKFGIPFSPNKYDTKTVKRILSNYKKGLSAHQISKKLNLSETSIFRRVHRANIARSSKEGALLYYKTKPLRKNEDFFSRIDTEEKAYWLGFFAADGCVYEKRSTISFHLSLRDKEHLQKFADLFWGKIKPISERPMIKFCLGSIRLCTDLISLGIVPRKSKILSSDVISNLSNDLQRHFIRGYFDGDGCLYAKGPAFSIASGSEGFLLKIQSLLCEACHLNKTKLFFNPRGRGCFSLCWGGALNVNKIQHYLYTGANIWLKRKYKKIPITYWTSEEIERLKELKPGKRKQGETRKKAKILFPNRSWNSVKTKYYKVRGLNGEANIS